MNPKRSEYQKQYQAKYKTRVKRVNLTFHKDEHRALLRGAKSQGKKTTTYIKELALAGMRGHVLPSKSLEEELKTLKFAIRNIANNVNQIAHHSNIVHDLTQADENNLLQHLKQLEEAVERYTEGRILESQGARHDH